MFVAEFQVRHIGRHFRVLVLLTISKNPHFSCFALLPLLLLSSLRSLKMAIQNESVLKTTMIDGWLNVPRHRQAIMNNVASVLLRTPSSNWTHETLLNAVVAAWNSYCGQNGFSINCTVSVRDYVLEFLVRNHFDEVLNIWVHSDRLMVDAFGFVAHSMKQVNGTPSPAERREVVRDALSDAFIDTFGVPINAITQANRVAMHTAVLGRIRPIMGNPAPATPGLRSFVRDFQNIANMPFWSIVEDACDRRLHWDVGFSFWEYYQATLDGHADVAAIRDSHPTIWQVRQAHYGFVECIIRRMAQ